MAQNAPAPPGPPQALPPAPAPVLQPGVPPPNELVRQYAALVKAFDVDGLKAFLTVYAGWDCNVTSLEFGFNYALFWIFARSNEASDEAAWTGRTPQTETVRLLVRHGIELEPSDDGRHGPLHFCATGAACRLLLELGCSPHTLNAAGQTPLHMAALKSRTSVMSALLVAGARVNQQSFAGHTALRCVLDGASDDLFALPPVPPVLLALPPVRPDPVQAQAQVREAFSLLLDAGASLTCDAEDGKSPMKMLFDARVECREHELKLQALLLPRLAGELEFAAQQRAQLRAAPTDFTVQLMPSARRIEIHRSLLSACSEKFRAMLSSDLRESREGLFTVEDRSEATVERLIQCASGQPIPKLPWNEVADLVRLADEYLMPRLKQRCEERLCAMLRKGNAIDSLRLAHCLRLESLRLRSVHLIAANYTEYAMMSENYAAAVRCPEFAAAQAEILQEYRRFNNAKRKRAPNPDDDQED